MKDIELHELQAEVIRLKTELEDSRIYADGLSKGLEKAQVNNRSIGAELAGLRTEYHATRNEVDRWKRMFNDEYENRKIENVELAKLKCAMLKKKFGSMFHQKIYRRYLKGSLQR